MTRREHTSDTGGAEALVAGDWNLMKALMREALEEVLEVEMSEFLGAEPGERTEARRGLPDGLLRARPGDAHR